LDARLAAVTVFLSPMNYFRLDAAYVTLADLAACATLFAMLLQGRLPRAPFGPATPLWLAGVLALAAGLTLGSVAGGDMTALVVMLAQYLFSLVVLPFVLAGRPYPEVVALLKVLVAAIVVVMAFGAYVVHFVDDPDMRLVSGSGRLRSLVERENECAGLGAIAIVLLVNLAFLGEIRRWTVALVLPVLLYGVALTGSNTGLILTVFGVSISVLCSGSLRAIASFVVAGSLIAAAVLIGGDVFLPEVFRERVLVALIEGDLSRAGSFAGRYELLQEAAEIARDTLLVGLGADRFRLVSTHGAPVHNTYMLLLAEGGMTSLVGLVLLLLSGVWLAWAAFAQAGARTQALITLILILIFAAMLNTFAHFYGRFWNVPPILAMALAASCLGYRWNTL
jgi:hypothetical protein